MSEQTKSCQTKNRKDRITPNYSARPSPSAGNWNTSPKRNWTERSGDTVYRWPLLITKELIDNALDACETGTEPPVITVTLDGTRICVADNGPGLSETTLTESLNYLTRTSDKAHYVAPTREQIGNALKCLWATPFVYSGVFCDEQHEIWERLKMVCIHGVCRTNSQMALQPLT